ncbi:MAG: n-acetylglutamate synthase [Rhizobacter sp.]|nr:n-acetylglutamate synthase [Ferruginibacter sp.]
MISYNNKYFRPVNNTANGETSAATIFHYMQEDNIITAVYAGGRILKGQLIGLADADGKLTLRYQQVNDKGELMTGICLSAPEIMANGKLRLKEKWKWTSGDFSEGESVIEEI